jgi:hypothetical protein
MIEDGSEADEEEGEADVEEVDGLGDFEADVRGELGFLALEVDEVVDADEEEVAAEEEDEETPVQKKQETDQRSYKEGEEEKNVEDDAVAGGVGEAALGRGGGRGHMQGGAWC